MSLRLAGRCAGRLTGFGSGRSGRSKRAEEKIEEKTSQDDDEEYERFRRLAIEKYLIDDEEMISNLYRRHMKLKEERESIEDDELEQERRRIR